MSRRILLVAVVLLGQPLAAQSPAQRLALAGWRDSLTRSGDVTAVAALGELAGSGDKALRPLRRAFYNARRGELAHDRGALEKALLDFDQASARHRDWPWPEYGSALVFRALHFGEFISTASPGQMEGESDAAAVWRHLRNALKRDPDALPARQLAIELLVRSGDRELPSVQQQLLDGLLRSATPEADALLVLGRTLRGREHYDSALQAFVRSGMRGGDGSRLALERARTLRAMGDSVGAAAAYWSGLAPLSFTGRVAYRTDLAWIVGSDSLAAFDTMPTDSIRPWLERFWARRDIQSATGRDGRLMEHLRRWAFAFAHFKVALPWRRTMFARVEIDFENHDACVASNTAFYERLARVPPVDSLDIRAREPLLDHRGLVYLRHGMPLSRQVLATATGLTPIRAVGIAGDPFSDDLTPSQTAQGALTDSHGATELWLYWMEGDWRVLFFRGSKALGDGAGTTLTSYMPISFANEWWVAAQLDSKYGPAADQIEYYLGIQPKSCLGQVTSAIATSRMDALTAITTDSDSPPLTHPWNSVLDVFTVGSEANSDGRAIITFALPTAELQTTPRDSGRVGIDVRFRLSAYNRATGAIVQIDTVRHFGASGAVQANQYLSGLFEVPLTPGMWDVSVLARQERDSTGAYALSRARPVAIGTSLALSDVVTGTANGRILWRTPESMFPLNPLGAWTPNASLEIYYEIYGLPAGTGYRGTLELRPAEGQKAKSVIIGTTGQSTGLRTVVRRSVGLTQLKPGQYRLIITIHQGADSVVTERPLLITAP
ncbi:MAG: hypothetical protein V4558_00370 [Gemmatimonadota bacterium]